MLSGEIALKNNHYYYFYYLMFQKDNFECINSMIIDELPSHGTSENGDRSE